MFFKTLTIILRTLPSKKTHNPLSKTLKAPFWILSKPSIQNPQALILNPQRTFPLLHNWILHGGISFSPWWQFALSFTKTASPLSLSKVRSSFPFLCLFEMHLLANSSNLPIRGHIFSCAYSVLMPEIYNVYCKNYD